MSRSCVSETLKRKNRTIIKKESGEIYLWSLNCVRCFLTYPPDLSVSDSTIKKTFVGEESGGTRRLCETFGDGDREVVGLRVTRGYKDQRLSDEAKGVVTDHKRVVEIWSRPDRFCRSKRRSVRVFVCKRSLQTWGRFKQQETHQRES